MRKQGYERRVNLAAGDPGELVEIAVEVAADHDLDLDEEHDVRASIGRLVDEHERSGTATPLPEGLRICRWCGEPRGVATRMDWRSRCRCEGIPCRHCAAGRVRRPISDHYVAEERSFWHTPYFMAGIPCEACALLLQREGADVPAAARLLASVREATETLRTPSPAASVGADRDLVAVFGDERAWGRLGVEPPLDDRPLWLGRAADPAWRTIAARDDLRTGAWSAPPGVDVSELERALRERWGPPVR